MSTTQNTPSGQNDKVEEYDLVILGGGTGGTVAVWTFASKGQGLKSPLLWAPFFGIAGCTFRPAAVVVLLAAK